MARSRTSKPFDEQHFEPHEVQRVLELAALEHEEAIEALDAFGAACLNAGVSSPQCAELIRAAADSVARKLCEQQADASPCNESPKQRPKRTNNRDAGHRRQRHRSKRKDAEEAVKELLADHRDRWSWETRFHLRELEEITAISRSTIQRLTNYREYLAECQKTKPEACFKELPLTPEMESCRGQIDRDLDQATNGNAELVNLLTEARDAEPKQRKSLLKKVARAIRDENDGQLSQVFDDACGDSPELEALLKELGDCVLELSQFDATGSDE